MKCNIYPGHTITLRYSIITGTLTLGYLHLKMGSHWVSNIVDLTVHRSLPLQSLRLSNLARQDKTVGEIVNLMSVDAQRLLELMTFIQILWSGPFQIILSVVFLWFIIGPSVFAGLGMMLLLIPINAFIGSIQRKFQVEWWHLCQLWCSHCFYVFCLEVEC